MEEDRLVKVDEPDLFAIKDKGRLVWSDGIVTEFEEADRCEDKLNIFEGRKTNKYLEYELKRLRLNSLLKKREKKLSLCLQNEKKLDSLTTLKAAFVEKTRNLDKMNEEKVR